MSISTRGYTQTLSKQIKIKTNDKDAGSVILTMKAEILEILSVTPAFVNLGKVDAGSIKNSGMTVLNKGKAPVSISRVTAKPESIISVLPDQAFILKPGEKKQLDITFNSGFSKGHTGGYVTLETDIENLPKKIIRVRAQVVEKKEP
ncbi:MAG TPA: DUF1573 domain-containing protein [Deltaproteobacteria bacterium]|nr:DUF1573 domain-containing protein [Deltaproteobacteria bacterium]